MLYTYSMDIHEIASKFPGTVRRFKAGTPIVYQGEIPRYGFFLKKGLVKVYNLHSSGSEQILRFYNPGSFFPLPWLYGKVKTEFYFYEAIEDCEVVSITKQDIQSIVESNPKIKQVIFDSLLEDQSALNLRIISLEQPRATEKLAFTFYYLLHRYGKHVRDDKYIVELSLTHTILANLVGLTRETITMEINKLKRKGALEYSKKIYTVDKQKLEQIIGEDSFSELIS